MSKLPPAIKRLTVSQFTEIFVEKNKDAVILLNTLDEILTWNLAAEELYGYCSEDILNKPVTVLFPQQNSGDPDRYENLATTRAIFDWDSQQVTMSGAEISTRICLSPLFDKAGSPIGKCFVARERRSGNGADGNMRHAQKLETVGRLAGGVAHDFNNLLTVITGYNDLLRACLPSESPLIGYVVEVEKAADRAASLTNQLLTFSRRAVTIPEILNINDVAEDLERMLQRIIGRDIAIDLRLAPDIQNLKADPGQVSQLLMNLATNARDAMPHGGVLGIKTNNLLVASDRPANVPDLAAGSYVQIEFSDTGTGMDDHTREHAFDPYFTTKEVGKGTGLGLSIVYGIVSRMRGYIHVTSKVGEGTMFTLSFPATAEESTMHEVVSPPSSESKEPIGEHTILLVDDEPMVRHLVKEMLTRLGYVVQEAATVKSAIELNDAAVYDLLLTDIVMPGMQGGDLAMRLQEVRPALKVLYMSGYVDDQGLSDKFLRAGNFLQKPFSIDQLASQLTRVLRVFPTAAN